MAHAKSVASARVAKIHALTALRFFAAFWVVVYHARWSEFPGLRNTGTLGSVISMGYISVTFFFLLSGYILAMVYLSADRPIQGRPFLLARFARIYPLYLLTLVVDIPSPLTAHIVSFGMARAGTQTALVFLSNLLMIQAWDPHLRGIDFPNWSLSVEAVFYILFSLLGKQLWRLNGWALAAGAAFTWFGSQTLVWWITPHLRDYNASYNPLLHVPTFVLGILLAR